MNIEILDKIIIKPEFIDNLFLKEFDLTLIKSSPSIAFIFLKIEDQTFNILQDPKNFRLLHSWFKYNDLIIQYWDFMNSYDTGNFPAFIGNFYTKKINNNILENLGFNYDNCERKISIQ